MVLALNATCVWALAETQDFAAAVAAGKMSVTFRGTGGSSGDAIEASRAHALPITTHKSP